MDNRMELLKRMGQESNIKRELKSGSWQSGKNARILVYESNNSIFRLWENEIFGDRFNFLNNTKVYRNGFNVSNIEYKYNTQFGCYNKDCSEVALELINEGLNPAILNLASNKHPCGGYDKGTSAQEESLCQMSTLSQSLYQFGNPNSSYFINSGLPRNISGVYPMDINFGGIYTPNVCFFRYNKNRCYEVREEPFKCGVITVASLSNRVKNDWCSDEHIYFQENGYLNSIGREIEGNKIRTIYRIGLENGHDSLVLGAFGCGVYNLKPDEISKMFFDILNEEEFKKKYKKIVFAIYESNVTSVGDSKFKPFYNLFK